MSRRKPAPKPRRAPAKRLERLLTDPPKPGQRCRTCAHEGIKADLTRWQAHRAAGGRVTLNALWHRHLVVQYDDCPSFTSVRGHLLRCEKIDPVTARPVRPA